MIDIKNIDGSVLFSVLPDESAVFHEELMASDYVKLSWDSDVYKVIPAGAYIEYEGEKYKLLDNYSPTQQDECTYQYTPQFQSRVMNWDKQITPVYTYEEDGTTVKSREMDWGFTGSPADAMYIVKQAIKNETGEDWTIQLADSLPATISISSQSASIFATLNTIANECDTEWWADKKTNTLYLSKCIFGDAVKLEVGDNVQVPTVTNDSEGYFTRFYAFGSTRNITQDYYSGQATNSIVNKRLTLNPTKYPNGYKDIKDGLNLDEMFVKVLYFDEIYPSSKLTISDVRARLKYRLDNNGQKIRIGGTDSEPVYEQYAIWYFQIAGFTFDPSTDVIEGLNLSASFESGQLASRDFELTYHKTASTVNDAADVTAFNIKAGDYEIVIDESSGTIIPGTSYIIPQDGDSLVLFNIVMPDEYVTSAQDELEKALDKAMLSYTEDNNSYQMSSDPTRFYENGTDIQMGQAVTFVKGSKSLSTRVQMVEKRLDLSCYQTIKIGNKIIKGNTQQLKDEVASVNQNLDVIKAFNELSSSLSQAYANAQREMIEGFASIKNLWTLETDERGNQYAYTQYDIFGKGGITAYTVGKPQVPSIFDGLPLDNMTIWKNPSTGLIEVIGGTGGGGNFDSSKMWELLGADTSEQINISHLTNALSGYVPNTSYTAADVLSKLLTVDGSGSGLDADLLDGKHYTDIVNGNVSSATKLQTPRTLWGQSFDGTNNVSGDMNNVGNLYSSGEIRTSERSGFRIAYGDYGFFVRNDGQGTYFMLTNEGDNTGPWNDLRPIYIENKSGNVYLSNGMLNLYKNLNYAVFNKKVGILKSSPSFALDVNGAIQATDWFRSTGSSGWYSQTYGGGINMIDSTYVRVHNNKLFRCDAGFSSGESADDKYGFYNCARPSTEGTFCCFSMIRAGKIAFGIGFDSDNRILLGNATASKTINTWTSISSSSLTMNGNILATGGITCYSSDQRAKTIVEQINLSLKQIANASTIRFKWNNWKIKDDGKTHIGGIAQYVQGLLPETILEANEMLNMDYATVGYVFSVQTARHLQSYETKTDREIRKLKKKILHLEKQLKKLGYEEVDTLVD